MQDLNKLILVELLNPIRWDGLGIFLDMRTHNLLKRQQKRENPTLDGFTSEGRSARRLTVMTMACNTSTCEDESLVECGRILYYCF